MSIADALGFAIRKMSIRQTALDDNHVTAQASRLATWIETARGYQTDLYAGKVREPFDVWDNLGGLDVKAAVDVADSLVKSRRPGSLASTGQSGLDVFESRISLSERAQGQLDALKNNPAHSTVYKAVSKALAYLGADTRHSGLNTHTFHDMYGPKGEKVFEAYAQNHTPGAYRIFFYYGDGGKLTIQAITSHP